MDLFNTLANAIQNQDSPEKYLDKLTGDKWIDAKDTSAINENDELLLRVVVYKIVCYTVGYYFDNDFQIDNVFIKNDDEIKVTHYQIIKEPTS